MAESPPRRASPRALQEVGDSSSLSVSPTDSPNSSKTSNNSSPGAPVDAQDDTDELIGSDKESDNEDVKRWLLNPARQPAQVSQKRRADLSAFDLWIEQNQNSLSKRAKIPLVNDKYSAQALVRNFENRKIITSPRDYQLELFERAKVHNTIAVLDTGSGKTLIAALLLRWIIEKELEDRAKGRPKRIAFFLVDKVALVFQQHAVLSCNLDYPVEKLCGEMVDGVESKDFWAKTFSENMAVVCTAEILYGCLHHSWIRMDQINLLVFDEAHHTKKNHPYARIIKDFYTDFKDVEKRPRILGMTASPVDAKVPPERAAAELEGLLHSRIATVADPTVLQQTVCKPKKETVLEYDRRVACMTELDKSLRILIGGHKLFRKPCAFATTASLELGPWCVDRFWQLHFEQEEMTALEAKTVRNARQDAEEPDRYLKELREAREMVKSHGFSPAVMDSSLFSSKVMKLVEVLRDQFKDDGPNRKCIVFVEQRNTAMMLGDLFQQDGMTIPGVRFGVLMGGGSSNLESPKISFRDQVVTILKFRRGELNCLFATTVAEEGLDIPDCNVIVRFDLYHTLIQYIQSRGRARQSGSEYIHMIEKYNMLHQQKVAEIRTHEDALRKFCQAMPEDRKLSGNDYDMDYFLRRDKGQKQYTVPQTGAKLTYRRSLVCLASFVASLPHPPETVLLPEYVINAVDGGYQSEVILPTVSPITSAIGQVHPSKAVAKCSAAFEMCLQLIKGKYLDNYLGPIFTKQLPAMRNSRLAIGARKKAEYNMRINPEIWSVLGQPTELYATVLTLTKPEMLGRPSSPLMLLTRRPMPQGAPFPLFFGEGRSSVVRYVPLLGSVPVDEDSAHLLARFTLRIFEDVFSKQYEASSSELPYFLAPVNKPHGFNFGFHNALDLVSWDVLRFVDANEKIQYKFDASEEFFTDKFVIDPYDGARKFYLLGLRRDLKPADLVPDGIIAPRHRPWKTCSTKDIYNYSISLWSRSREKMTFRYDQPVAEAELLSIRRNLLDENVTDEDLEPKKCFLILEPMRISALPVGVIAMAYNFPAIIHRLDSNLIALDACALLGLERIRPDLALEAFTKDRDVSEEHDIEKSNIQGGMGKNYERLEFLGDCFLKMATTISIFTLLPGKSEFEYHVERMLLLCNQNLLNNALEVKLEEFVRSMAFNRRTWYPEGLKLTRGKRVDTGKRSHVLANKSIADVCEAIIGAAYLTARAEGSFDLAVQAVTAMVKDKKHAMKTYAEYYAAYKKPEWQTATPTVVQRDMVDRFHKRMGYRFTCPQLLRSAFQHPTYPSSYEGLPSYQRLEFLGDSLFDMACIDYLFHRFPGADPQWLTEHKMAMVSNQFLGCLGYWLGFHRAILASSAAVQKEISDYVLEMDEALRTAKEQAVQAGGSEADFKRNFWIDCGRPPKSLPDVVEAYIGAIFVDSQYNYGTVQEFFDTHVLPWFVDIKLYDAFANKHPVTFLTNLMQKKFRCQDWRILVKDSGVWSDGNDAVGLLAGAAGKSRLQQIVCGTWVHGKMLTYATAVSTRYAKLGMAKDAVRILERMQVDEFKAKYGCDCGVGGFDGMLLDDPEEHGSAT
ncbi:hypothetical protein QBC47DRAFT_437129 [Echria macrotheca]|uniref:Dicer-like protein 1 n=1 Tax=Echria macrotheca TaxID=438768 RepID=A0AAJ0BK48_9PEZI|nr:hypothetical protein QBC47DRAFT_437129 [Echria macrotheca]